jgi:transcriptional regulator with XRE-family HTH domain
VSSEEEAWVIAKVRLRRDQLATFRRVSGLDTEAKLADAMGANQGTVNKVIRGKAVPSGQFIGSLMRALNATFDELWEIKTVADDGTDTESEAAA